MGVTVYNGFRWTNVSARRNGISAEYEPLQPFFLLALAKHAGCRAFLDVGANIGNYSMFASLIPSVERIVAFEASPYAAEAVRANAKLNGLDIEVKAQAVSSAPGTVELGLVSNYAGNNAVGGLGRSQITVSATTLDDLGDLPEPVCMKIDVEGHELPVLEGATKLLSRPCIVQIEKNGEGALNRLRSLGYSQLTRIGPDYYFTNLPELPVLDIYEQATQALIDYNHKNKVAVIKRGDIALQVSGRSYHLLKAAAQRLAGRWL